MKPSLARRLIALAAAITLTHPSIASTGDAAVSAQLQARAERFFAGSQPGGVVLVRRGDDVLLRQAWGQADVENAVPMSPEAVFRIASSSKPFTALGVLKLVEANKLRLDQEIGSIDDSLTGAIGKVNLRQLLTHTSGIRNISSIPESRAARREEATAAQLIGFFKDLPLEFEPGSRFSYSNSNYIVASRLIEIVSGMSYADYMQQTLFRPLGMDHTRYGSHIDLIPQRAQGYQQAGEQLLNADFISMSQPQGAGGLVSTVDDLGKWDSALHSGKLLAPALLADAFSKVKLNDGSEQPYGFGWVVAEVQGERSLEHSGFINGFNSGLARVPGQQVFVAVLTNSEALYPGDFVAELAATAMGKPYDMTPVKADLDSSWLGRYRFADGAQRDLLKIDGKLHSQRVGNDPIALIAAADGRYYLTDSVNYLSFATNEAGQATMTLHDRLRGDSVGVR